jgi:hypothetical protein
MADTPMDVDDAQEVEMEVEQEVSRKELGICANLLRRNGPPLV